MTARLGVSVHRGELRGVLVRRARVVWHGRAPAASNDSLGAALACLLRDVPHRRPRACVALGLAFSQLKVIEGLPAVKRRAVAAQLVRENAESFFLRAPNGLVVTDAHRDADGALWAAALDALVVADLLAALRRRGCSRVTMMPYAAAAAAAAGAGVHELCDDGMSVEITVGAGGAITRIRRLPGRDRAECAPPASVLAGLDAAFEPAYRAAVAPIRGPFAWHPPRAARAARLVARAQIVTAAALFIVTMAAAVAAPGVRAARSAARLSRELNAQRSARIEAARVDAELRRVTDQLDRIARFSASRGRVTQLVGALAQSLPDSTALVSLGVDSAEGSFTALAPHAADILPQLSSVESILSPRIVGSVTREAAGAARVERATVRFRRARPR